MCTVAQPLYYLDYWNTSGHIYAHVWKNYSSGRLARLNRTVEVFHVSYPAVESEVFPSESSLLVVPIVSLIVGLFS